MESLVVFDNVEKRFGAFTAVKGISFEIGRGEFVAIMGPSGCGKTTTLRMLAGLEQPDKGRIRLNGENMNEVPPHARDTPMVWQSLALFPFLNVRENVEFGLKMRGMEAATRRTKTMDWLERLGIAEFANRSITQLSGGQRQRVALARALVIEPEILLLDEPLSALDAHLVIRMQQVLTKLQRDLGITFVYVTHSQSEAFAMADRVIIMSQGDIAQIGTPKDIYRAPLNRFVAEFVGSNNIISGQIMKIASGKYQVFTPSGVWKIAAPAKRMHRPGDDITFAIAADQVRISAKKPRGTNVVAANLISEEFIGSVVTLFLETDDGTEFKAQVQERELAEIDLKSAKQLYLTWPADQAHILEGGEL